ncbi:hypothetical protein AB0O28_19025 [Microbispora sp. NPDC088329]|uniref:hypothetical protein n=1 Tax=Microbispora sp. NPDC088329 TaxID=3154869 RepID=UPI0034120F99
MTEQPNPKPPLPQRFGEPFPRITVDESDGSPFDRILRIGVFAADSWALGPDGPIRNPHQTKADICRGQVREALLHLLELGLVDIDVDRLNDGNSYPAFRGKVFGG